MEAIILNRILSKEEEHKLLDYLNKNEKSLLYANVDVSLQLAAYSKGKYELSIEQKKSINYHIIDKVVEFGELNVNKVPVADQLTFEKASVWHYHKFRIYFAIRNLYYEVELINQLKSKFNSITYYAENKLLDQFNFDFPGLKINAGETIGTKFSKKIALKYAVFFLLRSFLGFLQLPSLKHRKQIVVDHAIKQTCLNLHSLKPELGNYNLQYLFEKLDENFIIFDDIEIPKFQKGQDFKIESSKFKLDKNRFFPECILLKGLLSLKTRKNLKEVSKNLLLKYQQIEAKIDDPIQQLAIQQIISLHSSTKLFLFKYLAYRRFFSKYQFKSITSIDENSARIKSIFDAAKSNNMATIGIQHGTIHELHPAYIYTQRDQKRNIVPDYTMVWGNYWSNFLIDHGKYDPDSLKITGQIRTDIIPKLKSVRPEDYLKVPKNSKLIVFASQPQRDPKLREQAAFDVFTAVKDLDDVHLVVKLHPAEKNDKDYYHNIAKKAGCSNYQILLDIDLYLLISLSNIMITCFSTVGAETVYFNKPLIILDHLRQDIQGYYKEGIAFQAFNVYELKDYLVKLLSGEIKPNETAYQKYISNYAYKIDGKVTDRIIEFIKSLK